MGRAGRAHPPNVDPDACTVRVVSSLTETDSGTLLPGLAKSAAGRRTLQLPPLIVPSLRDHLDWYAQPGDDGLVFVSPRGTRLRRSNFRRRVWLPALTKAGLPEIHFHDLRHTGNILTVTAGASLRELMARMGHASARAALVYLHDTDDRQRTITTVISDLARTELGHQNAPSEGVQRMQRAREGHDSPTSDLRPGVSSGCAGLPPIILSIARDSVATMSIPGPSPGVWSGPRCDCGS